ncbi:MAG: preprotein translocase subunit SecE [Clostridia bacterium]|nr:preprotein translocase subunit SecE [Clostridia bacterium]
MANKESSEAAKKIAKAEKEKTAKKPKKNKKNIFKVIARFFKDLKGEVKKITWPGAKDVLKGTAITIACIAVIGIAVFLVDFGLTNGIDALRNVAENRTTTTTEASTTTTTTTTAAAAQTLASSSAAE